MESGITNFEAGNVESLNPNLHISEQADLLPYDSRFEFPLENLILKERIGRGAFGIVVKAIAIGISDEEEETFVAVKTFDKLADKATVKTLISELKVMIHLGPHLNIVNLLGAVTKNIAKRELLVITEFCCHGNLEIYLRKHRSSFVNLINDGEINFSASSPFQKLRSRFVPMENDNRYLETSCDVSIDTANLVSWSIQVARGMEYLASKKVLHGDLAARNVLLTRGNLVKICDFGLAKYLYQDYSYTRSSDIPLPFKWLALETMSDHIFSVFSDVWSYGDFRFFNLEIRLKFCSVLRNFTLGNFLVGTIAIPRSCP